MKFTKKASVPIGTIVIIIIVLIAGLGIWWWFTQGQCGQYDDVESITYQGNTAYTHEDYLYGNPEWVMIGHEADGSWRYGYHPDMNNPTEFYVTDLNFDDLPQELESRFKGDGTDRYSTIMHIWNAIEKGCV